MVGRDQHVAFLRSEQIKSYKDLLVWQKSMYLVELVYHATQGFPKEELYGLINQIRRAVVSVPSNIAEGQARHSTAEFRNFLSIARGSLAEVETQLIIALRLKYLNQEQFNHIMQLHEEVGKMLLALLRKLAASN